MGTLVVGDCREILKKLPTDSFAACITDPPYNYEFIGHKWDREEIGRRLGRVESSKTLVRNIPYGSGLAGGVRDARWYERVRENILDYQEWCFEWGKEVFRTCKPGAYAAVFNSTRTMAHVQVAMERAGFYARDCLVYRRQSGIPKGLNFAGKLRKIDDPSASQWEGWHSCLRSEWEAIVLLQKPLSRNYLETMREYGVGLMNAQDSKGFKSNIIEGIGRERSSYSNLHCTPKPVELMRYLIELLVPITSENCVLDPFAGSGSTLVAAKQLGVPYYGIEIDKHYVEIARERLLVTSGHADLHGKRDKLVPQD